MTEDGGGWFECGGIESKGYASLDRGQGPGFSSVTWESVGGILTEESGSRVNDWEGCLEGCVLACLEKGLHGRG